MGCGGIREVPAAHTPHGEQRPEDAVGSRCCCQALFSSRYRGVVAVRNPSPAQRPLPDLAPFCPFGAWSPWQQDPAGALAAAASGRCFPERFVSTRFGRWLQAGRATAAAVECLQQNREALRVYQDTAACRSVWGYCGKSQPPSGAVRVLEAPAETEHQQLLAQTCLCASHLAKMETELSPGFVSHIPKHKAVPAASLLAVALKSGVTQCQWCGVLGQGPPCQR